MDNKEAKLWLQLLAPSNKLLAKKFGAAVGMSFEDIQQETWIVINGCLSKLDPERNVLAYIRKSMFRHMTRLLTAHLNSAGAIDLREDYSDPTNSMIFGIDLSKMSDTEILILKSIIEGLTIMETRKRAGVGMCRIYDAKSKFSDLMYEKE